jgi:hypothetical protein
MVDPSQIVLSYAEDLHEIFEENNPDYHVKWSELSRAYQQAWISLAKALLSETLKNTG